VELSTDEIERPSQDPREYASLRHNLYQVQRELAKMRTEFEQAEQDLIRAYERRIAEYENSIAEYENSLSWRVTRPLRQAAQSYRRSRHRT
jgi:uncharacterized protein